MLCLGERGSDCVIDTEWLCLLPLYDTMCLALVLVNKETILKSVVALYLSPRIPFHLSNV